MTTSFLGKNTNYWVELESRAKELDVCDWVHEIACLKEKNDELYSAIQTIRISHQSMARDLDKIRSQKADELYNLMRGESDE